MVGHLDTGGNFRIRLSSTEITTLLKPGGIFFSAPQGKFFRPRDGGDGLVFIGDTHCADNLMDFTPQTHAEQVLQNLIVTLLGEGEGT